jgi:hypothetical protein
MNQLAKACAFLWLILAFLFAKLPLSAQSAKSSQERVHKLIAQLGNESCAQRNQAARELELIGPLALDVLRAAIQHQDVEISSQAARLISLIEQQDLTSKMLAAKKVRLVLKDVAVREAVSELAKLSGCRLEFAGAVNDRTITLDTGEVTFWEALHQLCQKAELTETVVPQPVDQPPYFYRRVGKGATQIYMQPMPQQPASIVLTDGVAAQVPVCLQGSLRIRALPAEKVGLREMQVWIDVCAETRLQGFGVVGNPIINKIIDDHGKMLTLIEPEAVADSFDRFVPQQKQLDILVIGANPQSKAALRIKLGPESKNLQELTGKVTVQALSSPELLVKVDRVLTSVGRSFSGKDGNAIHMQEIAKQDDGSYRVRLVLENPSVQDHVVVSNLLKRPNFRNNFNNNGLGVPYAGQASMPKLIDADGKEFAAEVSGQGVNLNQDGQVVHSVVLTYRPSGEPAQLVLHGQRTVLYSVPFTLKNVPVP